MGSIVYHMRLSSYRFVFGCGYFLLFGPFVFCNVDNIRITCQDKMSLLLVAWQLHLFLEQWDHAGSPPLFSWISQWSSSLHHSSCCYCGQPIKQDRSMYHQPCCATQQTASRINRHKRGIFLGLITHVVVALNNFSLVNRTEPHNDWYTQDRELFMYTYNRAVLTCTIITMLNNNWVLCIR